MLIGLLSDTHIATTKEVIPPEVFDAFRGVDLILHAGDIWVPWVLDELEKVAPVLVGRGDDDMEADIGNDSRVEDKQVLLIEGLTIWVTHIKPRYGVIRPTEDFYTRKRKIESPHPDDVGVDTFLADTCTRAVIFDDDIVEKAHTAVTIPS